MLIAAVDLVSNTCFPALAAEELGFFKEEGLDVQIELVPMLGATKALRNGSADADGRVRRNLPDTNGTEQPDNTPCGAPARTWTA